MHAPHKDEPQNPYLATAATSGGPLRGAEVMAQPIPQAVPETGDGTGGLIPYKNPKALISYYLGIFSLLPVLGFPLGLASIILGVGGLRARRRTPIIKGSAHAIIGIVLGVCGMPLHLLFGMGIAVAIFRALSGG